MRRATHVYRYRTERGFLAAMERFGGRVLQWWGEDHSWAIEVVLT